MIPSHRKGFLKGASASLVDQALLSLINLAIGMVFIKYSSKGDYALYAQIMALVFFTTSIQSALITSPALTLMPRKSPGERADFAGTLFNLQAGLSLLFAVAFGVLATASPGTLSITTPHGHVALAFALAIWVAWLRDFVRNQLFIGLHVGACLKLDVAYAVLSVAGFGCFIGYDAVSAANVLVLLAAAGAVTAFPWLKASGITFSASTVKAKGVLKEVWPLASWALPGGIISWAFGNGYVLIAAKVVGADATAEIVAARLFIAPLGMVYLAWGNVFRPRASHWLAAGDTSTVIRVSYAAVIGIAVAVVAYLGALLLAYPLLQHYVLGAKYQGLVGDVAWWGGFFLASGIAGIGTGVLLALGKFKDTFFAATAGCLVSIPLMIFLGSAVGKSGILMGLMAGEVVTALWLLWAMRRGLLALHTQGVQQ